MDPVHSGTLSLVSLGLLIAFHLSSPRSRLFGPICHQHSVPCRERPDRRETPYLIAEYLDLADSSVHQPACPAAAVISVNLEVQGDALHSLLGGEVCAQAVHPNEDLWMGREEVTALGDANLPGISEILNGSEHDKRQRATHSIGLQMPILPGSPAWPQHAHAPFSQAPPVATSVRPGQILCCSAPCVSILQWRQCGVTIRTEQGRH